ncbi:MAG: type transport system ATP-binding protein [Clostridia bacterium]|nr:type transport system ATP-binding protein [Clostridia bacterium]
MDINRRVIIEAKNLSKHYGPVIAVDKLNLSIYEGEIFGLLGPNGAGKTTTILMILGLTEPTEGKVLVAGHDATREPLAVKSIVGYLPDNVGFYNDLTGRENLAYTAALNRIPREEADRRIARALQIVGLEKEADRRVREYSRGMRQRLGIADVMIKNPRVAILDEPTLGIDPKGVQELLALIVRLSRQEGLTVLISSHQLHQVQQICDRVGIFVQGKLLVEGPIASLGRQVAAGKPLEIELQAEPKDERLISLLRSFNEVESVEPLGDRLLLRCRGAKDIRPQLVRELTAKGIDLLYLRARGYDLDHIYRRYFQGDETYA